MTWDPLLRRLYGERPIPNERRARPSSPLRRELRRLGPESRARFELPPVFRTREQYEAERRAKELEKRGAA